MTAHRGRVLVTDLSTNGTFCNGGGCRSTRASAIPGDVLTFAHASVETCDERGIAFARSKSGSDSRTGAH